MSVNIIAQIELNLCQTFERLETLEQLNKTIPDNDTKGDATIELEIEPEHIDFYDDTDRAWVKMAVIQVGYYLRSHKFNEFDRRLHKNTTLSESNMYESFPEPPLKYFHWDVFDHCKYNFIKCLRYLFETTLDAHLQYSVDTTSIIKEKKFDIISDNAEISQLDKDCKRLFELDMTDPIPFEGILDKFVWRVTASYYMCWFTLQMQPELEHFETDCDNYASCLNNGLPSNHDYRADDNVAFACAMYSFCPDPCCSTRRSVEYRTQCDNPKEMGNPCRMLNNKTCTLNATLNNSLTSIVYNQWNATCVCKTIGFEWKSRYGMCVDFNECHHLRNPCDETEDCSNAFGNYFCFCKFGYEWSTSQNRCVDNEVLIRSLKRFSLVDETLSTSNLIMTSHLLILISIIISKWIE